MGGSGSGNWYRSGGPTCEDYFAIDVGSYARKGLLQHGTTGWTRWSRGGEETGSIGFRAGYDCLTLIYRTRPCSGEWEDVEQRVSLTYTTPHFGGSRPWFACPNCGRRCGRLYGGSRFYCRKCWGLSYESQREHATDRLLRRAQKIRQRLGGSANTMEPLPERPTGMHHKTYMRLCHKAEAIEAAMWGAVARRFQL